MPAVPEHETPRPVPRPVGYLPTVPRQHARTQPAEMDGPMTPAHLWRFTHPRLDGPLDIEGRWSEGPMRMFALRYLMSKFPGEWDIDDLDNMTVTDLGDVTS